MKNMGNGGLIIEERLCELADATRVNGEIWRAIYTKEDKKAKQIVRRWMEEAGLKTYKDTVGNLFGRVQGKSDNIVLVGSHIDTVKNGGKYDGASGIITAISAIEALIRRHGIPEKTLEVVALVEEEGSRYGSSYIGSKAITGKLADNELYEKDEKGIPLYEAMKQAGYNPEKIKEAERKDIESFIELHIEQGPILDEKSIQIGIVESIVGIISYEVSVKGIQNHAGTTPMNMRKDSVFMTALLIKHMTRTIEDMSDTATFTVGRIQAFPGISNVIASEVHFSIDIRDSVNSSLKDIEKFIFKEFEDLKQLGYEVYLKKQCNEIPIYLDSKIISIIEEATSEINIKAIKMNSGAGHDAQIFADVIPTGMIFIPSKNGISHSPDEYTSIKDLEVGLTVLKQILKKIAWN